MKIWVISDSHTKHRELQVPDVDMVIFAGDCSYQKDPDLNAIEVSDFIHWFKSLKIKYKIMIAGNHDVSIERGLITDWGNIIYLFHETAIVNGIKIFGSPYTPKFGTNWAFNVPRWTLSRYWDQIPEVDILITHGPPKGILDMTQYDTRPDATGKEFFQCGCQELLDRVKVVKPKYHIFGHIHSETNCPNTGMQKPVWSETLFINASTCGYEKDHINGKTKTIVNNGIIIDYDNNTL